MSSADQTVIINGEAATVSNMTETVDTTTDPVERSGTAHSNEDPCGSSCTTESEGVREETNKNSTKKEAPPVVGMLEIFRFSDTKDRLLMVMGTVSAIIMGAITPVIMIVLGNVTDAFIHNAQWENIASDIAANLTAMCPRLCDINGMLSNNTTCGWCQKLTADDVTKNLETIVHNLYKNNHTQTAERLHEYLDEAPYELMDKVQQLSIYFTCEALDSFC